MAFDRVYKRICFDKERDIICPLYDLDYGCALSFHIDDALVGSKYAESTVCALEGIILTDGTYAKIPDAIE
jgi:hypothetical protein